MDAPTELTESSLNPCVPLKHAFNSFGKWCSFPQELFNVKNRTAGHSELAVKKSMPDDEKPNLNFYLTEEKRRNLYIANFYVTRK